MNKQIEFNRPKKYTLVEELGSGACGRTVRLLDTDMNVEFVAKKYSPAFDLTNNRDLNDELLDRFRDEARILYRLSHPNVVRVYNFYDYREIQTAFILMEYVEGSEILQFLSETPHLAEKVFEGVVEGFGHLQERGVLHRDIRPANILVNNRAIPKIIDFGFGKVGIDEETSDLSKSISLNWWCDPPPEFADQVYDFQTEVYFVGKLFEKALSEGGLADFKYRTLVGRMCDADRKCRIASFQEIQSEIALGKFEELSFSNEEKSTYRNFATELSGIVSSVQSDARFERDDEKVMSRLEELLRKSMLEEVLPAPNKLAQVFISGNFRYWKQSEAKVATIRGFLDLLRGLSVEKRNVVIENILFRLEASDRTEPEWSSADEIPF